MLTFCPTCANLLLGALTASPRKGQVSHIRCDDLKLAAVEHGGAGFRFYCQTCPYVYGIEQKVRQCLSQLDIKIFRHLHTAAGPHLDLLQIRKPVPLQQKEIEDVFGGDEAWANLPKAQGMPEPAAHSTWYLIRRGHFSPLSSTGQQPAPQNRVSKRILILLQTITNLPRQAPGRAVLTQVPTPHTTLRVCCSDLPEVQPWRGFLHGDPDPLS